jgi:hypothetical protein
MIPGNIETLIKAVIDKTSSKKAIWGKTSRPNEFKLHFEKGAVTTDYWVDENGEIIDFGIYNAFGDRIDNYYALKGSTEYELLYELHSCAKRNFYKVDETISSIFSEVKSDKNIGKREVENLDDLPF